MNKDIPFSARENINSTSSNIKSALRKNMSLDYARTPDYKLIKYVTKGNIQAYGELYHRYLDEIYRYIYYRSANNQLDSEDLTQEVFIRAWNVINGKGKPGKKGKNFRALLYRIAHNLTIDRWRTNKSEVSIDDNIVNFNSKSENTLERTIIRKEEFDDLHRAILELSPQLQDVFICRFINSLSHADTAEILGLKENHVRVLQHRALKMIRIRI